MTKIKMIDNTSIKEDVENGNHHQWGCQFGTFILKVNIHIFYLITLPLLDTYPTEMYMHTYPKTPTRTITALLTSIHLR